MESSSRASKHTWTKEEEAELAECLVELVSTGGWRSNNGTFRPGYLAQLQRMMAKKLPDTYIQGSPMIDFRSNVPNNMFNDGVSLDDSHREDIPTMYSQGVHMPPDEMFGTPAGQTSERRNCSSGSKRKRGSQHYEMVEVIRSAMEFGNDQLKAIADRATEVELRAKVVKQLQDIPELQAEIG
ncbi:retrotransposon protein [Cucumis melo var. makuwa]|uniref:Retrotransposon protein n=1 Tax=Cucumis melo var. makuwa TaxID=1194695 RepID=A0A5A7VKJ5_CUCMM|nr:retrotransposon protein [Cucumis melo var. makuwa]TYK21933.1 retrotransposon protein [Cucumis melo var. makuwa]